MNSKRFSSLHAAAVLFVFVIMMVSGLLAGLSVFLLHVSRVLPNIYYTPLVLPFITIFVCVVIGTVLASIASRKLLMPVKRLIDATRLVAKGDFSVRVDAFGAHNEIAELIRSFNGMTQELSSIEMFREDFINTFSHEFKTPIVSIRGFARQLKNDSLTPQQRGEYVDIIIEESERLTNMSANILLLTKLENQNILTATCKYSLDEQIRRCILLLEKQWSQKNIVFNIELEPVIFLGDEEMLSYVWLNILNNAIKFSKEGGEITVRCVQREKEIKISVSDNGIGMQKETLAHIFEKFYQGDASRCSVGNGLGLPLVKRIVELCGGHIRVVSEVGRGTSFSICLPADFSSEEE